VLLEAAGLAGTVPGVTLDIDRRGVVLSAGPSGERIVPWADITGWRVDAWVRPGEPTGTLISYAAGRATYRIGVPAADVSALGYLVDQLSRGYLTLEPPVGPGPPATARVPGERDPADRDPGERSAPGRFQRIEPVLVALLIVVLVVCITLILLQSAGVIHLPYIGGSGNLGNLALVVHPPVPAGAG
jgi:hypothetical protein